MAAETESLPYVDEHSVLIEAPPEATWEALLRTVERSMDSPGAARGARLLGCADSGRTGPEPLAVGSTVPGFHVEAAEPPHQLALVGSHRFSRYALTFRLDADAGGTRLRAETRAEFPGLHGRAYRGLVIGTRLHVLATRRLLGAVEWRAERGVA